MRLVLLEAWQTWQANGGKDLSSGEHRLLKAAKTELLKFKMDDGSPRYTAAGIWHRLDCVLCELLRRPRPVFDENAGKGKNTKPQSD